MSRKTTTRTWYYGLHWSCHNNEVNGNIFITLVVYLKHMKKSKWLDCQGNEFFPKQKGTQSLVKIDHKNTATLDSARSKKKSKVAVLQLALCNLTLKSSVELLGENNARRLLKSVQNHEILINNMSVNMSDYFKNTIYQKKIIFLIDTENFSAKFWVVLTILQV